MAKLKKEPAKYFGELDLAVVESQMKDYPLKTCLVSGKPPGSELVDYVIANQLVRLADFDQLILFQEAPGKFLKKLQAARH